MTTMLERIENELRIAGYKLEPIKEEFTSDDDYVNSLGTCAYEICKQFCNQGHSGMSAEITLQLIYKLLKGDVLTPLTNNPDEWANLGNVYQSKRKFSCFSYDLKTYYDNEAEENREYELDENGEKTGWYGLKEQKVMHELKQYKKETEQGTETK